MLSMQQAKIDHVRVPGAEHFGMTETKLASSMNYDRT